MITTPDLIAALSARPKPVRRLSPPLLRAAGWLAVAGLLLVVLFISHRLRPDFATELQSLSFRLRLIATAATGAFAAVAAFVVAIPGRSRLWLALPLPSALVWVGTVGHQCLTDWVAIGPNGMGAGETARCFATLVIMSLPMGLTTCLMQRHARHYGTMQVSIMSGLAISGITAFAMTLFHPLEASALILIFNFAAAAFFVGVGAAIGRVLGR